MTATEHSVLLVGNPSAGKSNYLFRLWLAIDSATGALAKDGLPEEITYLRHGAEKLLQGEFSERTAPESEEKVTVPVQSAYTGTRGVLVVPDPPGEQVVRVYRTRQWSAAWEDLIGERCGCLFFVRADSDETVAPLDWVSCFRKLGTVLPDSEPAEAPKEPPTQVLLVDWLQMLRRAFTTRAGGALRPRVGIVVSAWDAVPAEQQAQGPEAWIKDNFPMLHQFMQSNGEAFEFGAFGVSIVSGDLKADAEFKATYLNGRPQDFGFVLHSLHGSLTRDHDITLPVAWALGFPTRKEGS